MNLFDDIERIDLRPALYAEPMYKYLNATARPPMEVVRALLQQWADDSPEVIDRHWVGRFRNENDRHHLGALFELYTCVFLKRQGFKLEREPLSQSGKHPDFLVRRGEQHGFVLECRLAADQEFGGAEQRRISRVYDAIDRLHSPNFFLFLRVQKAGSSDLAGGKLRDHLTSKLAELNPDSVSGMPSWRWSCRDWTIEFSAIAKNPEARGKSGVRSLGGMSGGAKWEGEIVAPLLDALEKKASRYYELQSPYIIAISSPDILVDHESYLLALYGDPIGRSHADIRGLTSRSSARGFWYSHGVPCHTRVSAVMFVAPLVPWLVASATPLLYHNPWASFPLSPDSWSGSQFFLDLDTWRPIHRLGKRPNEILGLSPSFPIFDNQMSSIDDQNG